MCGVCLCIRTNPILDSYRAAHAGKGRLTGTRAWGLNFMRESSLESSNLSSAKQTHKGEQAKFSHRPSEYSQNWLHTESRLNNLNFRQNMGPDWNLSESAEEVLSLGRLSHTCFYLSLMGILSAPFFNTWCSAHFRVAPWTNIVWLQKLSTDYVESNYWESSEWARFSKGRWWTIRESFVSQELSHGWRTAAYQVEGATLCFSQVNFWSISFQLKISCKLNQNSDTKSLAVYYLDGEIAVLFRKSKSRGLSFKPENLFWKVRL